MITIGVILASYLAWAVYSIAQGRREAWFFTYKYDSKGYVVFDPHRLFSVSRISAVAMMSIFGFIVINWWIFLLVFLMSCAFPFLHDGSYYDKTDRIRGGYPKRWLTNNNYSTAKFSIQQVWVRIGLLIVSIGGMLAWLLVMAMAEM